MVLFIVKIILLISFVGLLIIIFRKVPHILALPIKEADASKISSLSQLKNKLKNSVSVDSVSIENLLQKILSKARVFTMKTENKTATWLESLRQRSKNKNEVHDDKYWEGIKKSTNNTDEEKK